MLNIPFHILLVLFAFLQSKPEASLQLNFVDQSGQPLQGTIVGLDFGEIRFDWIVGATKDFSTQWMGRVNDRGEFRILVPNYIELDSVSDFSIGDSGKGTLTVESKSPWVLKWEAEGNRFDKIVVTVGSEGEFSAKGEVYHNEETNERVTSDLLRFLRALSLIPEDVYDEVKGIEGVTDCNSQLQISPFWSKRGKIDINVSLSPFVDDSHWWIKVFLELDLATISTAADAIADMVRNRFPVMEKISTPIRG